MKSSALLLAAVLALAGCSKAPEAASASIPRADAQRAARAVALVTGGQVCSVAPTGSMRPTFDANALLVTEPVTVARVGVGDIVVRKSGSLLIVHRVVRIEGGTLVTRGDANPADDPGFVTDSDLSGRVVAIIYGAEAASVTAR